MARALYDNLAESPDELAFRRGDTLTVLEQNTGGSEGWWLCTLRGRQVTIEFNGLSNAIPYNYRSITLSLTPISRVCFVGYLPWKPSAFAGRGLRHGGRPPVAPADAYAPTGSRSLLEPEPRPPTLVEIPAYEGKLR